MNNQKSPQGNGDIEEQIAELEGTGKCFSENVKELLQIVLDAQTQDLFELAKITGLNPLVDYAGGDLNSVDLSNKDLSGADLRKTNLTNANLKGANLSGADLSNSNLSGANLSGANLSGANLSKANLNGADLSKIRCIRAFLMEANLNKSCLNEAVIIRSNLSKTNLSDAQLRGANFQGANLESSDLRDADFSNANLQEANLKFSDLSNANLSNADISDINLRESRLKNTNFTGTDLTSAVIEGAVFGDNLGIPEDLKPTLKLRKALLNFDIKEVLREWEELNESDRTWMIEAGESEDIPDGKILIKEDVRIEALFIVLRGQLKVSTGDKQQIATLSSGEVVGEMSFVRPLLYPCATVEAIQNSRVWRLPHTRLTEKLENDLDFGCRFYKALTIVLSKRLRDTTLEFIVREKSDEKAKRDAHFAFLPNISSLESFPSLASLLINGDTDLDAISEMELRNSELDCRTIPSS